MGNSLDVGHRHADTGVALHAQQTDAELALHQLANHLHAAVAQGVNVVWSILSIVKANNFLDDCHQVVNAHNAVFSSVCYIQAKALVDFVATNAAEIKALEVKEHA